MVERRSLRRYIFASGKPWDSSFRYGTHDTRRMEKKPDRLKPTYVSTSALSASFSLHSL
uniref:Uncharacterized protein n=1 Tax=Parascaris equorum TaxID=6256 RepID=A0A914RKG0_PAREQ